jgi:hypothetical protein
MAGPSKPSSNVSVSNLTDVEGFTERTADAVESGGDLEVASRAIETDVEATNIALALILAKLSADPSTATLQSSIDAALAAIKTALETGGNTEQAIQAIVAKLIAAPATEAKQDNANADLVDIKTATETLASRSNRWVDRRTDNVANGSWNTARSINVGNDRFCLSALAFTLTISGLTDLDWYLSWDSAGAEPITDRQSWDVATDMALDRSGTKYIAVAKIDIFLRRPSGIGVENTIYLHTYGTGGTATGVFTASGHY